MQIRRTTDQSGSLVDHFQRYAEHSDGRLADAGRSMLKLIESLAVSDGPVVWAFTSVQRLYLVDGDDSKLPTRVTVASVLGDWYDVEYRLPDEEAPWPEAYVTGCATGVDQATEMILIGLRRSLSSRPPTR